MMMTLEELKAEAAKLGYKLIKQTPMEHYLPCICGCRQKRHWHDTATHEETLACRHCNLSVTGKPSETRRLWNEMIRAKHKEIEDEY